MKHLALQLLLFLCGCLKKSHRDGEAYACLLRALLTHLDLGRQDMSGVIERSPSSEVYLLILRFLNIIMSRRRMKSDESKVFHALALFFPPPLPFCCFMCLRESVSDVVDWVRSGVNFLVDIMVIGQVLV